VVLGYPKDGPFDAEPPGCAANSRSGGDIYGNSGDVRQVYAVRSLVAAATPAGH
jgi:hypothetical protein